MILELDVNATPEEWTETVSQHLDIWKVKAISRAGFDIVSKGWEPNFSRRDMAKIINLRVKIGDTTLGFENIKASIHTGNERGYDGEWVDYNSSVLTIKFAPLGKQ